jgi:hypothetical protein
MFVLALLGPATPVNVSAAVAPHCGLNTWETSCRRTD